MEITFSKKCKEAILHSHSEAIRFKSASVAPEHLFMGIVKTDGTTRDILREVGLNVDDFLRFVSQSISTEPTDEAVREIRLTKSAEKIMKTVHFEAQILKEDLIQPYHLLLAILREPENVIHQELERLCFMDKIREEIRLRAKSETLKEVSFFRRWFYRKKD
jgi:ATP-dependent Clp protease ATP-binding subunit ClpC